MNFSSFVLKTHTLRAANCFLFRFRFWTFVFWVDGKYIPRKPHIGSECWKFDAMLNGFWKRRTQFHVDLSEMMICKTPMNMRKNCESHFVAAETMRVAAAAHCLFYHYLFIENAKMHAIQSNGNVGHVVLLSFFQRHNNLSTTTPSPCTSTSLCPI